MDRIRKEVDTLFKNFLNLPKQMRPTMPAMEIKDRGKEIVAKISLPGMDRKNIDLKVMPQSIELKTEKKFESHLEKKGYQQQERKYQGFYRAFPLPAKILTNKTKTLYKNGVLEIHMPKAAGTAKIRKD